VALLFVSTAGYGAYRVTKPRAIRPAAAVEEAVPTPSVPVPAPASASATPARRPKAPQRDGLAASGVPMPIGEIPGWYQTFTDDFAGTALGDQWFSYSGGPSGDNGGWFMPSHVSVGNGLLTIRGAKEQTPRGLLYATGGVSNHNVFSQTYGRFDVRFRMDRGVGIAYALLLWPTSQHWPPELDIIEDNGRDRQSTSATAHYDHDDKKIQRQTKGDFTQWHTATLEWTPNHLVYRLDGTVWATIDSPHVPNEPMDLALQTQAWGCGGTWEACPNSTTPPVVDLQVDWVSLYGWTGP
jgi:beta-glucanase (GH16 family)